MTSSVSRQVAGFYTDPAVSSAVTLAAQNIAAPVVRGAALEPDELDAGGGVRVVMFVLDRSPSMVPVATLLLNGFNQDFVPAVRDAREDDVSVLRIGGISFSTDITPIWAAPNGDYFHTLDGLPALTTAEYDPNSGYSTALHAAIMDATHRALRYAAELQASGSPNVDVDIIILSDGANNCRPDDPAVVKQLIDGRDKTRVRYGFFYFQTDLGLSTTLTPSGRSELEVYATQKLGIDGEMVQAFLAKPGETAEQRAKRFRGMMRVLSRVSASRNTSAVVATSQVLNSTDDEVV